MLLGRMNSQAACVLLLIGSLPCPSCSPLALLRADAPGTLRLCAKALKSRPAKTRVGVLGVLRQLAIVLPDSVAGQVALLLPGILQAINVRGK